jgi:hypothetical protein
MEYDLKEVKEFRLRFKSIDESTEYTFYIKAVDQKEADLLAKETIEEIMLKEKTK